MATQAERFQRKVSVLDSGCWQWMGTIHKHGYGRFYDQKNHAVRAHRWAYSSWIGPIPDGMTVDHTCHDPKDCAGGYSCVHRSCVNPGHMQIVTIQDNLKRRASVIVTHCPNGHEYSDENTYVSKAGTRQCVTCNRDRARERQRKVRALASIGA